MTDEAESRQHEETIVAVKPGFGAAGPALVRETRRVRRLPLTGVAAIVLLGLAGIVFFSLPRWVEKRAETQASLPAPAAQPADAAAQVPALNPEELAALQSQAESLLSALLQQRSQLETLSAAVWAPEDWIDYEERSRAGDDALLAEAFADAIEHYSTASDTGQTLLARADRIVAAALVAADEALGAGDALLAANQYDIVLGIDPENASALQGKGRAEKLPSVRALMQRAEQLRQDGLLREAAAVYRETIAIDAQWAPARLALDEVTRALAKAHFESLLSSGFSALADEEYAQAEQHFLAVLELDSNSRSARDGLRQAEEGQKLDAIALSEARALAFERRELWAAAVERYEAALAEDATVAFALTGLARSRARADLDTKLENLLANPNLLLTDNILDAARGLAAEARPLAETGPRIGAQIERLDQLIEIASTPVNVQLQSDAKTEVTVYRVGALGAFAARDIQVRPGTYTAVGSRDGYRDVRATFTVLPGREVSPVRIICDEPI